MKLDEKYRSYLDSGARIDNLEYADQDAPCVFCGELTKWRMHYGFNTGFDMMDGTCACAARSDWYQRRLSRIIN